MVIPFCILEVGIGEFFEEVGELIGWSFYQRAADNETIGFCFPESLDVVWR